MPGQYGPQPQQQKSGMSGCLVAFLVVLAVVVIGGIVAAILFFTVFTTAVDSGLKGLQENVTVGEPAGGIGDPVRDGQFEFVVKSFECDVKMPGMEQFSEFAPDATTTTDLDMRYCVADLHIRNIGTEPRPFTGVEQRVYAEDSDEPYVGMPDIFDVSMQESGGEIRPGQTLDAKVYFAVPKNVKPALLDLHDFVTSGGVTVRVG